MISAPDQLELAFADPAWPAWSHLPGWSYRWKPAPCPDCGKLAACDKCLADVAALVAELA